MTETPYQILSYRSSEAFNAAVEYLDNSATEEDVRLLHKLFWLIEDRAKMGHLETRYSQKLSRYIRVKLHCHGYKVENYCDDGVLISWDNGIK